MPLYVLIAATTSEGLHELKRQSQKKFQTRPKEPTALDDLWSLDQKLKKSNLHNSQIAGPSKHNLYSVFEYSSDSTVEEKRKEDIDYDTIHPPSPKISKGGTNKKSKVHKLKKTISKKHDESLIDVDSSTSSIDPKSTNTSLAQEDSASDSDDLP